MPDNYTPPTDACNTYQALLDGLADLKKDMHQHVHKENNILFPKAASYEAALAAESMLFSCDEAWEPSA